MLPLVSIITPSYNQARYIRQTIESVLQQDHLHVEHIVMDGGSTDGTRDMLQAYGERYPGRFRWVSEPDRGQSDALNKGLGLARGEFIGWQNSDDYYLPNVLGSLVEALQVHTDAAVAYSGYDIVNEAGTVTGRYAGTPFSYARLLYFCTVANQSALIRRRALDACGGLNVDLHYVMDYDLWLRLGLRYPFVYLPGSRGVWRYQPAMKTATGTLSARLERVEVVAQAVADPLFPAELADDASRALQRHLFDALLEALIEGQPALASSLLARVAVLDGSLIEWEYLIEQLCRYPRMSASWLAIPDDTLVGRVLADLRAALHGSGRSSGSQARRLSSLAQLYDAARAGRRDSYAALAHFMRAWHRDRDLLRYPALTAALAASFVGLAPVEGIASLRSAWRRRALSSITPETPV